jgi:uncharacterized phage-associated protein
VEHADLGICGDVIVRSCDPLMNAANMIDVRALANMVLVAAQEGGIQVTNMAINKIAYFVHCDFLIERGEVLVGAKIEAWQHGPVFRELYQEFKRWGDLPIKERATKVDAHTGEIVEAMEVLSVEEYQYLQSLIGRYINFSAAQLRNISHVEGSPWYQVWGHEGRSNPGMKISNELILAYHSPGVWQ